MLDVWGTNYEPLACQVDVLSIQPGRPAYFDTVTLISKQSLFHLPIAPTFTFLNSQNIKQSETQNSPANLRGGEIT